MLLLLLQSYTGCPVRSTYFVSLNFTNHSLVTDWYVAGNEIADVSLSTRPRSSTKRFY